MKQVAKQKKRAMKHKVLSETGSTRGTAYTMSNKVVTSGRKKHVIWLDQIHLSLIHI